MAGLQNLISGGGIGGGRGAMPSPVSAAPGGGPGALAALMNDPKARMLLSAGQGLLQGSQGQMRDIGSGFQMRDRSGMGQQVLGNVAGTMNDIRTENAAREAKKLQNDELIKRLEKEFELRGIERESSNNLRREMALDGQNFQREMAGTANENRMSEFDRRMAADTQRRGEIKADANREDYSDLLFDAAKVGAPTTKTRTSNRFFAGESEGDPHRIERTGTETDLSVNELRQSIGSEIKAQGDKKVEVQQLEDKADGAASNIEIEMRSKYGRKADGVGDAVFSMMMSGMSEEEARAKVEQSMGGPAQGAPGAAGTVTKSEDLFNTVLGRGQ